VTTDVLESIHGGLVVSCQAYPGEPMRDPQIMTAVAKAAVLGGAVGIRAQGLEDLRSIRASLDMPLIGLVKVGTDGVFITPTVADCVAVAQTGADIVALDGTVRPRPDGSSLRDCFDAIHAHGGLVMADCGSTTDAVASLEAGADCLGTTLAGYTGERARTQGPDFAFLSELVALSDAPVMAEGRIRAPQDAVRCLQLGAFAVVVGTAITHPTSITNRFARALAGQEPPGAGVPGL
jgi:N-acylglucosamine-6-phosphate 2-epimerase